MSNIEPIELEETPIRKAPSRVIYFYYCQIYDHIRKIPRHVVLINEYQSEQVTPKEWAKFRRERVKFKHIEDSLLKEIGEDKRRIGSILPPVEIGGIVYSPIKHLYTLDPNIFKRFIFPKYMKDLMGRTLADLVQMHYNNVLEVANAKI